MFESIHVTLINPPSLSVEDDRVEPPLGLLYIAGAIMERELATVELYDMSGCQTEEEINKKIGRIPVAQVYGITGMCTHYKYIAQIIIWIRNIYPDAQIIMGGPNASALPEYTLSTLKPDAVICGEGENAICTSIEAMIQGVPVSGILTGTQCSHIDHYPYPARDIVDLKDYSRRLMGQPCISMISSRGCAYRCIHCNSVIMGGGSNGVRYRSVPNVVAEIKIILHKGYRHIRFNDDHFTGHPHLEDLLKALTPLGIRFRVFARVSDLTEKTCKLLRQAGCVHVTIGLESMNKDNLKVIGKVIQSGSEANVKIARDNGLIVRASFIVGLPFDNDRGIEQDFQSACGLGISEYELYSLIPYPGTLLWEKPETLGYTIENRDFREYIQMGYAGETCYVMRHKNFTPDDVRRWRKRAETILEDGGVKHMKLSGIAT